MTVPASALLLIENLLDITHFYPLHNGNIGDVENSGIPVRLDFYSEEELLDIIRRGARVLQVAMAEEGAREIARRSRGTPRIAGRLLRRVRDFASVAGTDMIDAGVADKALRNLEVDTRGLDALDHRYLSCIAVNFGGGPVGVETIAASLSEARDAIEEVIEPFLIQLGFVNRTPRGRLLTPHAFRHLGLAVPQRPEIIQGILPLENGDD